MRNFDPGINFLGGFTDRDGTIEFFSRLASFITPSSIVLDYGAGRGSWYEDDKCQYRREVRDFKSRAARYVGVDIDPVVLGNRSTSENFVITPQGRLPFPDGTFDVIFSDYVIEHVEEPENYVSEIRRCLKPGGIFAARTPHWCNYVSFGARVFENSAHSRVVGRLQPTRKAEDVFPTAYKMNTLTAINRWFAKPDFENYSYLYRTDPGYYFGSRLVFNIQSAVHHLLPAMFSGHIYVFVRRL